MDYRELLKSYIRHVVDHEGVSFIGGGFTPLSSSTFTQEEWEEIERIDEEIKKEDGR